MLPPPVHLAHRGPGLSEPDRDIHHLADLGAFTAFAFVMVCGEDRHPREYMDVSLKHVFRIPAVVPFVARTRMQNLEVDH